MCREIFANVDKTTSVAQSFGQQIALGDGLGIRLNFDYFIFRMDAAYPLHDPSIAKSDGANMLKLDLFEPLMERLIAIRKVVNGF